MCTDSVGCDCGGSQVVIGFMGFGIFVAGSELDA